MKYTLASLCLIILHSAICAQNLSLNGENYLILNGERFKNQKVVLSRAEGDWFDATTDQHGAISFSGNYENRNLNLDIEWDGRKDVHIITDEVRHDGKRTGDFIITMSDKAVYGDGLNAYPEGDDEVHIIVSRIDEATVSGQIKGVIEQGREKVSVNGVFNLKKNTVAKKISNSSYGNCDAVIHDKLIGAEGRSPSECEAKFDLDVRTAIHDALGRVLEKYQNDGWQIEKQTGLKPLFIVPRGSEKDIFFTEYDLQIRMGQSSPQFAAYYKKFNELSDKLKDASKENYDQFVQFTREMNGATNGTLHFTVNNHGFGTGNYKGKVKINKLSNDVYLIQSEYVQARTGGGEDGSVDATFLLIGNWRQPQVENKGDGGQLIKASAVLNPSASHLQVQNIVIRIECSSSVAGDIVKNLDLQKLQSLIVH